MAVALIVALTNWVLGAKGAKLPKVQDDVSVYGIKQPIRLTGVGILFFMVYVTVLLRNDPDWPLPLVFPFFGLLFMWFAIGSVIIDQDGIKMKMLGYSRSLSWNEINKITIDRHGNIILSAKNRKLAIDTRFAAREHLLNRITAQTNLEPVRT